ncbi:cytochrome c biogenesis CcdA family protein [Brevibacterium daeguense]|uniref:Cytochrome c biogenesis CcdA family protein n=1 Tax=Brevibacterium daeguense TaxID=909936 RepID=A0ABP8EG31_9MICO|nr:cytochrome c biogenesis CcdA family protein [Brevibacterium daeguense]
MELGLVTAFLGGVLALLSPCGALLLPAFFASTVGAGPRLWLHGAVFYGGLLVVLVPLGMGAGALGALFTAHREAVIVTSSVLLIVFGIVQALGFGFDPTRMLPGTRSLQQRAGSRSGLVKTVMLGAVSGVAGFCTGPILGAVLTLAAAQGSVLTAGVLLGIYGAGMVVPLLLVATLWGRMGTRGRALMRGRTFRFLGRDLHTTSVVTGLLIAGVGVVFWATNGLVGVPELVPSSTQAWLQQRSGLLAGPVVDVLAILLAAGLVLLIWARARRPRTAASTGRGANPATEMTEGATSPDGGRKN